MECYNKIIITKNIDLKKYKGGILVDCGKCQNCVVNKRTEKSIRFVHEAETKKWEQYFLTFTYDEKNVYRNEKGYRSLNKKWVRKQRDKIYSKLYRKYIKSNKKKEYHKQYKYMIKGEYGEEGTKRPHYHIMLAVGKYTSKIIHYFIKYFKGGKYDVQKAESIKATFYTAGYTAKKLGKQTENDDIEQEFLICSRGMGKDWALKNSEYLKHLQYIQIPTKTGVLKHKIPRIYIEWLYRHKKWSLDDVDEYREKMQEKLKKQKEKLYKEIIEPIHQKLTGKKYDTEDDITINDTKYKFTTPDGFVHNTYYNYITVEGQLRNSILETWVRGRNQVLKSKAERKALEYKIKKGQKYVEY